MAKKSSVEKNERRKRMSARYAEKRAALKKIVKDLNVPLLERFQAQLELSKLPRNSAPSRVRNRCQLTGRARGYYRRFRVSRICLRALAASGQLPGVTKASW